MATKRNPAAATPAKAPRAKAPAATPATPAGVVQDASATPPAGGYLLLREGNPCKPGTMRHARWPLLLAHAGQPDGKAALGKALAAAGLKATVAGSMRYLRKHKVGLVG
jgi:hypothetical protein